MEAAAVNVVLNTKVDANLVQKLKPEVVIVATGASQILPNIPGVDGKNVVMANDVLLGKVTAGQEVVVIGARLVGADVAVFLAQKGKKVSVVDQIKILFNVNRTFKLTLKEELVKGGVYMYPESPVYSITENGVNIINDGEIVFLKADTVV